MDHSTPSSEVNRPMSEPSSSDLPKEPSSGLDVTVTPVQELVHDNVIDPSNATCHALPLFTRENPHREYLIRITEEGFSSTITNEEWDNKKNDLQISYSLSDYSGPLCIQAQLRFSTFLKHFNSYQMQHLTRKSRLLIPPKGAVWEEYTYSMDNVKERARRMQVFLWDVLNSNGPEILRSHLLQEALSLSPGDMQGLLRIAMRRELEERNAQQKVKEAIQKKQDAKQEALEESREMWNRVQTLDMSNPDTRQSFKFKQPHPPMEFVFHRQWFTLGNNNNVQGGRRGTNQQTWFRLERTDFPQMNLVGDVTYQLITTKGVPLLEMKERFRMMDYLCDLYYVLPNGQTIPALTVQRQFQLGGLTGETFNAVGRGPLAKKKFECEGTLFQETIRIDGKFVGQLEQHFLVNQHTLTVAPNQDCLLVLGIACAVVRIHAAREG